MTEALLVIGVLVAILVAVILFKTAVVVPQQNAFVVERLGRFSEVKEAGFHREPNWRLSGWLRSAVLSARTQSTSGEWNAKESLLAKSPVGIVCTPFNCRVEAVRSVYSRVSSRR